MNNRYYCRLIIQGVAFLVMTGLNSCQRASYSFQPVTDATSAPAEAVVPGNTLVAVADAPLLSKPVGNAKPIAGLRARPNARQKLATRSAKKSATAQPARRVVLIAQDSLARHASIVGSTEKRPEPTPKQSHKGVAVLLAVLLGIFGAHMFYLGHSRRALSYLITTLVCIGLMLIAIPVSNAAVFGGGLGGALVALFILLLGAGGILLTYLRALFDAVKILAGAFPY